MAKGDELVKYITERVVDYMETPKDVRRIRVKEKEPWSRRWFGMIPFSLGMLLGQVANKPALNGKEKGTEGRK
ncbi:YqzE family protein [Paenibacillus bouchesdurhonensis]|uniref:YqzE family protein n=1 Tax=Paenibacillus bouchesdurhonensis TaxID=1870990 RepID=UPI000DA60D05|nr:YqzE family protein [Paenibacillus bouchesdurhonensis]